ncbi:DUF7882 family protein [Rathayibacter oskolensis]|uniref:DUF7882 family protein n=1 Tax=Rathayibacter oskolensis TaxID=1891671 RepID=UPI003F5D4F40
MAHCAGGTADLWTGNRVRDGRPHLAHVKLALTAKLRRQESFLLSWPIAADQGSGRMSLWMAPTLPLQFQFSGSRPPRSTGTGSWLCSRAPTATAAS